MPVFINGVEQVAAGIAAPAGLHFIPASLALASGDDALFTPVFKDTTGTPDRVVIVTVLSASTIAVIEFKRLGNSWVFDAATCARDESVTLTKTAAIQSQINAFAIDNAAGTGDRVLFITTNDGSQDPDEFEINSIVLTTGALTAVLSVVAGTNQPTDTNNMAVASIPLSTTRLITFFQDDAHFPDITESAGTYTFTYDDAKVLAVDTSIVAGQDYSGICIGAQVILMKGSSNTVDAMWEMSTAAVLTEEFNEFYAGLSGTTQEVTTEHHSRAYAIDGQFALASPVGGGDASGNEDAWIGVTFPLDDI